MTNQRTLRPTETLQLETGLSLIPRIKLLLTIYRADKSVSPIDEWKFKRSLIDYIKSSFSITVLEEDLQIRKFKDLNKRKRDEPVAKGRVFVHDLGFMEKVIGENKAEEEEKFVEWRRGFVEKLDGIELNLEGVKFKLKVDVPKSDDFEGMNKEWEENIAFGARGYQRSERMQPDTIILKGMPSRWFAETRVSSKPSMLVTHTILSALGKIRNLHVAEDNDIGDNANEEDIVSGLHCKIVVRFENHKDFYDALKVLCGRSLQKQGSRLRADYDVTWDKDGFFRDARHQIEERKRIPARRVEERDEGHRQHSRVSQFSSEEGRRKRFKE
ncbi:A-kinase anchor protein 17A [Capsicum chacoense]